MACHAIVKKERSMVCLWKGKARLATTEGNNAMLYFVPNRFIG